MKHPLDDGEIAIPPEILRDIKTEQDRWDFFEHIAEQDRLEYRNIRKHYYPSVEEQLDMIYHLGIEGWREEIDKIKTKVPKGSTRSV